MKKAFKSKASKGFSLVELMLVIGAGAAMMTAALVFGAKVWDSSKVASARDLTRHLSSVLQSRFAVFPDYGALASGSTPASAQWVDGVTLDASGQVKGPWGTVVMMPYTLYTSNDGWSMTFNQVPKGACAELLSSVSRNFKGMGANGQLRWPAPVGAGMDPVESSELCSASVNSVTFVSQGRITSGNAPVGPKF